MVTRRQKLLSAGLVLGAGLGLSWPLKRDEPLPAGRVSFAPRIAAEAPVQPPDVLVTAEPSGDGVDETPPTPHAQYQDPFANTPAAVGSVASEAPVFSTVSSGPSTSTPPVDATAAHQIHVVHEGDSLDRLAKRYLGDEVRALEIFDLNREVLDNPHVLRIGVELRIPNAKSAGH